MGNCYFNENESTTNSKYNHYFKILQINVKLPQNAFLIPHKAANGFILMHYCRFKGVTNYTPVLNLSAWLSGTSGKNAIPCFLYLITIRAKEV